MWKPRKKDEKVIANGEGEKELDPTAHSSYFPGCEEYNEAARHPRFGDIYDRDDGDAHRLRREYFLIESARARAKKIWQKTGAAPRLADDPDLKAFWAGDLNDPPEIDLGLPVDADAQSPLSKEEELEQPKLRRALNEYGKEIFIESEWEVTGRPLVWYQKDSKGRNVQCRRDLFGVSIEVCSPITCQANDAL